MSTISKKALLVTLISALGAIFVIAGFGNGIEDAKWQRLCDGVDVVEKCHDADGELYSKYIYHEAEPEVTEEIKHPAEPAKTHVVHHPAVYGTRSVPVCIKTTIGYKNGTCALSRCNDGEYSGSTGRGTCSYHGGVWYSGGPWYEYVEEQYLISEAWDETLIDVPEKEAWTETVVVTPLREAWIEKEIAK